MAATIPTTSPPDVFRSRQLANHYFGADAMFSPMRAIPRSKYMFYARFVANPAAVTIDQELSRLGDVKAGISFKIKTIDKPKLELTTQELNQYNRKRYAYTKVEYQPVTVRLHDTVDNKPLTVWKEYFTYYFGDARPKYPIALDSSPVSSEFQDQTGWGLRPIAEELNFFDKIELYALFGQKYTKTEYIKPKMTGVDWTQYDSSSSEPDELSMTFKYEALQYYDEAPITPELLTLFGFDVDAPPIEPPGTQKSYLLDATIKNTNPYMQYKPPTGYSSSPVPNPTKSNLRSFGMNPQAYLSYTSSTVPTDSIVSQYIDANGYGIEIAQNPYQSYANAERPGQPNIFGIPFGSLPNTTVFINNFAASTFGVSPHIASSALRAFGSFNFGGR
jgi:hypothetical protein